MPAASNAARRARLSTLSVYHGGASSRRRWGGPNPPIDIDDAPPPSGHFVEAEPVELVAASLDPVILGEVLGCLAPARVQGGRQDHRHLERSRLGEPADGLVADHQLPSRTSSTSM
jgi:hypothetical protein